MNVLITGSRAPVAIDLAKHLALAGHKVWMADSLRYPIGRFSRYIQGHLFLPRPVESLRAFRQAIQNAVNQFGIYRVIHTCEEVFYYDDRW